MTMDLDCDPRPDGFTNMFFKTYWGVVASKVTKALHFFFYCA